MTESVLLNDIKSIKITEVQLFSFVELSACIGFSFGLVLGLSIFISSFFTNTFDINKSESGRVFGAFNAKGYEAGVIMFMILPLYFTFVFTVLSFPSFLPFRFFLKKIRGFSVCKNEKIIKES